MNRMKKAVAVLFALVLVVSSLGVSAATSSVTKTSVTGATANTVTYTGQAQKPQITVGGKTLVEGKDYVITGTVKSATDAGTYTIEITGTGLYEGKATVSFKVNPMPKSASVATAKAVKKTYKASNLAKKAKKIKLKVNGKKVTYKVKAKKALKNKIKVSKKGVVTLKKGIKKGTYRIVIKIKATKNYAGGRKVIKIKVK